MSVVTGSAARARRGDDFGRAAANLFLGVLPAALTALLVFAAMHFSWVAYDFSHVYYPAVTRLLDGSSPYAATHREVLAGSAFVYPALSVLVFVPFTLIPRELGDHIYMLICLVCAPGTLWALRVRDWRLYGAALLWFPIVTGWQDENVSLPLTFLIALAWRHRDRPLVIGVLVAVAISVKPLVWPLGLWLMATRRWKAAAWSLACGIVINLAAWAIVGFNEIHADLRVSSEVTDALWRDGYSVLAVAHHLGLTRGTGEVLLLALAAAATVGVLYLGLRKRDERSAVVLTIALMLFASPIVWAHYFVLLLLPLALTRPRFHGVWLLPVATWLIPPATGVGGWQCALAWVVAAICLGSALRWGVQTRQRENNGDSASRSRERRRPDVRLSHGLSSMQFRAYRRVAHRPRAC